MFLTSGALGFGDLQFRILEPSRVPYLDIQEARKVDSHNPEAMPEET